MDKNFVTYEIAKAIRELGFNNECLMFIDDEGDIIDDPTAPLIGAIPCPLWQEAIAFFAGEYIYIFFDLAHLGSDEWEYCYSIKYLPIEAQDYKKRATLFVYVESFSAGFGTYGGAWSSITKCQEQAILAAIKILVKQKEVK